MKNMENTTQYLEAICDRLGMPADRAGWLLGAIQRHGFELSWDPHFDHIGLHPCIKVWEAMEAGGLYA